MTLSLEIGLVEDALSIVRSGAGAVHPCQFLYDHCLKPEFQCRFKWDKGSIAMWDNSQTWHFAVNDYSGFRREMHRIVIG